MQQNTPPLEPISKLITSTARRMQTTPSDASMATSRRHLPKPANFVVCASFTTEEISCEKHPRRGVIMCVIIRHSSYDPNHKIAWSRGITRNSNKITLHVVHTTHPCIKNSKKSHRHRIQKAMWTRTPAQECLHSLSKPLWSFKEKKTKKNCEDYSIGHTKKKQPGERSGGGGGVRAAIRGAVRHTRPEWQYPYSCLHALPGHLLIVTPHSLAVVLVAILSSRYMGRKWIRTV